MQDLAGFVDFVELPREEETAVEAGIECTVLVKSAASDLYPAENIIPQSFSFILHCIK